MLCYRIVRPQYATSALSGEGARLYGGRWNAAGSRCVYTAGSRALAGLEMLVHLHGASRMLAYQLVTIEIDDSRLAPRSDPPVGWNALPAGPASQNHGHRWLTTRKHLGMAVPSFIIPEEENILLNPLAPGFDAVRVISSREFQLDLRLAGGQ